MGVAFDHRERLPSAEFLNRSQIHAGHHESRRERMPQGMRRDPDELRSTTGIAKAGPNRLVREYQFPRGGFFESLQHL